VLRGENRIPSRENRLTTEQTHVEIEGGKSHAAPSETPEGGSKRGQRGLRVGPKLAYPDPDL